MASELFGGHVDERGVLTLWARGMPQTKGSWRVVMSHGKPRLIPDNDAEPSWAAIVAWAAKAALRNPSSPALGRFIVSIGFTLAPVGGRGRKNRRDLDKLARSILDALTGIVWADDEQVEELHLAKAVGAELGAVITIELKG